MLLHDKHLDKFMASASSSVPLSENTDSATLPFWSKLELRLFQNLDQPAHVVFGHCSDDLLSASNSKTLWNNKSQLITLERI